MIGPRDMAPAGGPLPVIAACLDTGYACFERGGGSEYVNVGAFFDRRRRTLADDFMVKLFQPPTPGTYVLEGFTFTCNRGGLTFPGAGVILTPSAAPNFPTAEQLDNLQKINFAVGDANDPTCIDLGTSVHLESDQAAWFVVHLPQDTAFVGLSAERNGQDHPCDFMSRDGELWYRPDPLQSPYDWRMTVHYSALPARPRVQPQPWAVVKRYYK